MFGGSSARASSAQGPPLFAAANARRLRAIVFGDTLQTPLQASSARASSVQGPSIYTAEHVRRLRAIGFGDAPSPLTTSGDVRDHDSDEDESTEDSSFEVLESGSLGGRIGGGAAAAAAAAASAAADAAGPQRGGGASSMLSASLADVPAHVQARILRNKSHAEIVAQCRVSLALRNRICRSVEFWTHWANLQPQTRASTYRLAQLLRHAARTGNAPVVAGLVGVVRRAANVRSPQANEGFYDVQVSVDDIRAELRLALCDAVKGGSVRVVDLLLTVGGLSVADITDIHTCHTGAAGSTRAPRAKRPKTATTVVSPLALAAVQPDKRVLRYLMPLLNSSVGGRKLLKTTDALVYAVVKGDDKGVRLLLRGGVDVGARNNTALKRAIRLPPSDRKAAIVLDLLSDPKADVTKHGVTRGLQRVPGFDCVTFSALVRHPTFPLWTAKNKQERGVAWSEAFVLGQQFGRDCWEPLLRAFLESTDDDVSRVLARAINAYAFGAATALLRSTDYTVALRAIANPAALVGHYPIDASINYSDYYHHEHEYHSALHDFIDGVIDADSDDVSALLRMPIHNAVLHRLILRVPQKATPEWLDAAIETDRNDIVRTLLPMFGDDIAPHLEQGLLRVIGRQQRFGLPQRMLETVFVLLDDCRTRVSSEATAAVSARINEDNVNDYRRYHLLRLLHVLKVRREYDRWRQSYVDREHLSEGAAADKAEALVRENARLAPELYGTLSDNDWRHVVCKRWRNIVKVRQEAADSRQRYIQEFGMSEDEAAETAASHARSYAQSQHIEIADADWPIVLDDDTVS